MAQKNAVAGIWALGELTVVTQGTRVSILAVSGANLTASSGQPFTPMGRQLTFSAPTNNSGDIIVMYTNAAGTTNYIGYVPPGQVRAFPGGVPVDDQIDLTQIYIDTAFAGGGQKVSVSVSGGNN